MSYYGRDRQGQRLERTLPTITRKTAFVLCVLVVGIFLAYGTGRWIGQDAERREIEAQEVRYEPLATTNDCEDGDCPTGIRERGQGILDRLRRR